MPSEIFRLEKPFMSERKITTSFLQAGFCLNFYHAELARILKVTCSEIGLMTSAQSILQPGTKAYRQAILFIMLYQALFDKFQGNAIAIYRWLHRHQEQLNTSPHLLMVDEYQVETVIDYLFSQ